MHQDNIIRNPHDEKKEEKKYDGWTIQNCCGRTPWLVFGFAERTRKEAIVDFELLWGKGAWRRERRKGNFKLVKVKLIEVEE